MPPLPAKPTPPSQPLRILLLSDCWTPAINGVVRSISDLRAGLSEARHDVRILTVGEGLSSTYRDGVYTLASLPAGAVYPQARIGRPSCKWVKRDITAWAPDVIHSHTEFPTFLWARSFARRLNIAHVHTYHTCYEDYTHYFCPNERLGKAMSRAFTRVSLRRTDRIIAPTLKVADLLRSYGLAGPIEVISTGVDTQRFHPHPDPNAHALATRIGLKPGIPLIVTVGRLAAEKNLSETLRLLTRLKDIPWQWLVVGDGPAATDLRHLIDSLQVNDRVHMVGEVPAEQVARYYRLGDLFITSSRSETQGLTCLEALASGLPVITPDDEAFRSVVRNGYNGYRYESEEDFLHLTTALLADDSQRHLLGQQARSSSEELGRSRFVNEVLACYRRAIMGCDLEHVA